MKKLNKHASLTWIDEKIRELQSRLRQQALNDVWRDDERYNRGFEQGIQEERKKRNAGRNA